MELNKHSLNSISSTSRTFQELRSKTTNTAETIPSNENIKREKDAEAHEVSKPRDEQSYPHRAIK